MFYINTKNSFVKKCKSGFLIIFYLVTNLNETVIAQTTKYPLVRTSTHININRTVPKNILGANEAMPARFSKNPTDEEIYSVHFFEEPLVPVPGRVDKDENKALVYALAAFSQRSSTDDFTPITNFLKQHPDSRWSGALLANLGIVYRRTGYYNNAMQAWQQGWDLLKEQTDRKVKVLADRIVSELLLINAWVGRQEKIDSLLKEINSRIIEGPAVERVSSMRASLWTMQNRPGISFKCGPHALNKILTIYDSSKAFNDTLMAVQSTAKGFSLTELEQLAQDVGLNYKMAFRTAGAVVIPNAVVHWKLGHYSALLKMENGHYKCQDATMGTVYGQEFWITSMALDSSASGYFLIPNGSLPPGWRPVTKSEGSTVFGKGDEKPDNGKHVSSDDAQEPKLCGAQPMAQSNVHLLAVSLHIYDQPVYYTPPVGPAIIWNIDYHQRDSYQPANFSYSNLGPKWTFNWLSYVQDNPVNLSANAELYVMGGGARTFVSFNASTQSYAPELQTNDVLVRICPTCYELRHPDGSKEIYARPDGSTVNGRKIFLTQKVDAQGNAVAIMYDANLRIVALTDAIGQVTSIGYGNSSDIYKITSITDPFGRKAGFEYDGFGRMIKITDMIGIVSSFQYDASDFINKMTTPYGSTTFIKEDGTGTAGGSARALETRYPLGEKERVEYLENAPGINSSDVTVPAGMSLMNNYLLYRNTFYWDKKAMKEAPGNYSMAKIFHWLHGSGSTNESGTAAPVLESIKNPLESRIWHFYQGQTSAISANQGMSSKPSQIGRVLDDGTTQLSKFSYNSLGRDTLSIDPLGRTFLYKYDTSKIDLLEVRQTKNNANELVAKFTYNNKHLPLTSVDASGLTTNFTYNGFGQLTTVKNPKNEITTLAYNSNGYLQSITGAVAGSTVSFTYDGFGRVRTVTDPDGYTITTDYDALDRPTVITYPDGTFEQMVYDRLDAVHSKDRLSRWSHTVYDSLRRPNVMQDALGRVSQLIWCSCGSLAEIVDPLKQVTSFVRDIQGRVTSKIYHDGKHIDYTYESTTGRIKEVTDAKGQKTQYSYFNDDNLKRVDYANAQVATPSVAYTYDTIYNRVSTMTDGTGTTIYAYKPINSGPGSGQLASVDGPLANDVISYNYDSLDRVNSRSINGITSSVVFDALGRVSSATNALGSFGYNYVNQTQRLSSMSLPNGQSTVYDYFNNQGDQRLKEIWNKAGNGSTISKFDYEYNKEGQITKWIQQEGASAPTYYDLGYDLADQLISATQKNLSTSAIIKRYAYQYDKASNRTSEQIDNSVTSALYNNINQLNRQLDNGSMRFAGTVSKFSSMRVTNQTTLDTAIAPVDSTNAFEAFVKVVPGVDNIAITATDYSGNNNQATNNTAIIVNPGVNNTFLFDNNGNTTFAAVPGVVYDWDAADQLVKITSSIGFTEFIYDGQNRRVAEKLNGVVIKRWLWDGTEMVEERNAAGGTVTKRFFDQGEQINGTNYYFSFDHLGSIREMTDGSGVVQVRYSYDPYGRRIKTFGSINADFGFTGHYYHPASGLHITLYRAYDANTGRWLNRDKIEEEGGLNLYGYVANNPLNRIDFFGNDWVDDLSNLSAGFGDNISFGMTDKLRDWMGTNQFVDKCSGAYKAGEWGGTALTLATGIVGGIKAAGAKTVGKEFSHWIPNRMGGPRSIWNGNYVTKIEHALSDPYRYRFMPKVWKESNPINNRVIQQVQRIPKTLKGTGIGIGYGAGNKAANSEDCECK